MECLVQSWHDWGSKLVTILSPQEDNGTQETLTTRGHPISNSTLFKDRVRIGTDYGLYLSPVQIHDDGRKFTCHIVVRPGRVLRSSTTVKVFGKFLFSGSCHAPVTVPRFFPHQRWNTLLAREQPLKGRCSGVLFVLTLVIHVGGGDEGRKLKDDDSAATDHQFPGDH